MASPEVIEEQRRGRFVWFVEHPDKENTRIAVTVALRDILSDLRASTTAQRQVEYARVVLKRFAQEFGNRAVHDNHGSSQEREVREDLEHLQRKLEQFAHSKLSHRERDLSRPQAQADQLDRHKVIVRHLERFREKLEHYERLSIFRSKGGEL